jgi:hypothetical protein
MNALTGGSATKRCDLSNIPLKKSWPLQVSSSSFFKKAQSQRSRKRSFPLKLISIFAGKLKVKKELTPVIIKL